MSSIVITIKSEEAQADLKNKYKQDADRQDENMNALARYMKALASKNERASVQVSTGSTNPVAASGTWTLDTVVATDTVTVAGITFTGTDTPSTNLHFNTSLATDTLIAADIVRAVNAHPTTSKFVSATSAGAVVTVTAHQAGEIGNFIDFTDADSTITSSGSGYLAGGTGGTLEAPTTYNHGIT